METTIAGYIGIILDGSIRLKQGASRCGIFTPTLPDLLILMKSMEHRERSSHLQSNRMANGLTFQRLVTMFEQPRKHFPEV